MDEVERIAISDEGYDLNNPKVIAAIDRVRAELAAAGHRLTSNICHSNIYL